MPTFYVFPHAGSGGVNLRSKGLQDPSTLLGTLNEGVNVNDFSGLFLLR